MKSMFLDILNFLKSLTLIDYVLYFAILILIILVVSLIYLLKTTGIDEDSDELDDGEFDIRNAVEQISQEQPKNIDLTEYEKEQEEKAIISYEELVNSIKRNKINYEDENNDNNVSIKKVNLDNLISEEEDPEENYKYKSITFIHEEKYLQELKQLIKVLD